MATIAVGTAVLVGIQLFMSLKVLNGNETLISQAKEYAKGNIDNLLRQPNYFNNLLNLTLEHFSTNKTIYAQEIDFMKTIAVKVDKSLYRSKKSEDNKIESTQQLSDKNTKIYVNSEGYAIFVDRYLYSMTKEFFSKAGNYVLIEEILETVLTTKKDEEDISFSFISKIVRASNDCIKEKYNLVTNWFNNFIHKEGVDIRSELYQIYENEYIQLLKNLLLNATEKLDINFLLQKFIDIRNNCQLVKNEDIFYFSIKYIVENGSEELAEELRIIMFGENKEREAIILELAIYFYYIQSNIHASEQVKTNLTKQLKMETFGYPSFFEVLENTYFNNKDFCRSNDLLSIMEYVPYRLMWVCYQSEMTSLYVVRIKVYFAILKKVSFDFTKYNEKELLECRQMFENSGELKNKESVEIKKLAEYYDIDLYSNSQNTYKHLFDSLNKSFFEKWASSIQENCKSFYKNVFPKLREKYSKELAGNEIKKLILITSFDNMDKIEDDIQNEIDGNLLVCVKSIENITDEEFMKIGNDKYFKYRRNDFETEKADYTNGEINLPITNGIKINVSIQDAKEYLANKYILVYYKSNKNN